MTPGRKALETILQDCGIKLVPSAVDALWAYHQMLREANTRLNLTRIHQFDNMVLKHYVDSLIILRFEDLPSPLVDMGSGPGLPGVPLAIARPDVQMVLAEPRGATQLVRPSGRRALSRMALFGSQHWSQRAPRAAGGVG